MWSNEIKFNGEHKIPKVNILVFLYFILAAGVIQNSSYGKDDKNNLRRNTQYALKKCTHEAGQKYQSPFFTGIRHSTMMEGTPAD